MKKTRLIILAVIALFGLASCARPVAGSVLQSDKPRITSPSASQTDITTLVQGDSAFAFNLYQSLRTADGNLFYSPYSISEALAMTYAGARGNTEKQMAATMNFMLSQDRLHPAFNSLDLALASRGQSSQGKDEKGFRLHVVNSIWGQQDFSFLSAYLDTLAQNYGAGLRILDFKKNPEQSRLTINNWVSDQTEQKIKDLIPEGSIDVMTRLVLTNAIYFNAAWQYPFEKTATSNGDFFLLNGDKVTAAMMKQMKSFGYTAGSGFQAIDLPYDGRELSMVIILPEQGQFNAFEGSLNSQKVNDIIGKLQNKEVNLSMPKFSYESSFGLKQALTSIGMQDAFNPASADFSGMDGKTDLFIQDVVHKAYVAVDEKGTEAAAASGVVVGTTAMPVDIVNLTVNRPFIFLIRDVGTGTILFIGRVVNPNL
jgi:serpin B